MNKRKFEHFWTVDEEFDFWGWTGTISQQVIQKNQTSVFVNELDNWMRIIASSSVSGWELYCIIWMMIVHQCSFPSSGVVMSVSTGIPYYILFIKSPFKLTTIRHYWGKSLYYDRGKSNSVETSGTSDTQQNIIYFTSIKLRSEGCIGIAMHYQFELHFHY